MKALELYHFLGNQLLPFAGSNADRLGVQLFDRSTEEWYDVEGLRYDRFIDSDGDSHVVTLTFSSGPSSSDRPTDTPASRVRGTTTTEQSSAQERETGGDEVRVEESGDSWREIMEPLPKPGTIEGMAEAIQRTVEPKDLVLGVGDLQGGELNALVGLIQVGGWVIKPGLIENLKVGKRVYVENEEQGIWVSQVRGLDGIWREGAWTFD